MRILITRPLEDGEETARLLAERGHDCLVAPLLATRFLDGPELDLRQVQAFIATSANGVRALVRRTPRRDLPVFAVGPQTAQAARDAGFTMVKDAGGDAKALARKISAWADPRFGILMHAASDKGSARLADDRALRAFTVRREVIYTMEAAAALPPQAAAALEAGALDAALFYSPMSAEIFRLCIEKQSLPTAGLEALCISPATVLALHGMPLARARIAAAPNQEALLALVEKVGKSD